MNGRWLRAAGVCEHSAPHVADLVATRGRSSSSLGVVREAFTSFFAAVDLPLASWAL